MVAAVLGVVLLGTGLYIFAGNVLEEEAKADYYQVGDDRIPTVKLALGEERKITGIRNYTSTGGGVGKEYTYQVSGDEQNKDMIKYLNHLREKDKFIVTSDIDFTGKVGSGMVARPSVEEGQIILMELKYNTEGYTIDIKKGKGTVTPK